MIDPTRLNLTPAERADDTTAITAALRLGVRESLWMHQRLGHPVAVWECGKVKWIPAEEIPSPESPFWADADRM